MSTPSVLSKISTMPQPGLMKPNQTANAPAPPPPPPLPPVDTGYQSEVQGAMKGPMVPSTNLPSTQEALLKQLSYVAASYAQNVGPGGVSQRQKAVLEAWKNNASADFSQFTHDQAMSAVAQNPDVLFNEELAATQVDWSYGDAKSSLQALGLSAKDWAQYEKFRQEDAKRKAGLIMGAAEFVAGAAITYFSGGTLASVGVPLMVQGGKTVASDA